MLYVKEVLFELEIAWNSDHQFYGLVMLERKLNILHQQILCSLVVFIDNDQSMSLLLLTRDFNLAVPIVWPFVWFRKNTQINRIWSSVRS